MHRTVGLVLQSVFACGLACSSAVAGDLYSSPSIWTGGYIGLNAGGAWGDSEFDHTAGGAFLGFPPASQNLNRLGSGSLEPGGFIGGAQAGYNWQSGALVVGLEVDIQGWDMAASSRRSGVYFPGGPPLTAAFTQSVDSEYLLTLRPRIGMAKDRAFLYVTGGLAVTELKFSQTILFGPAPSTATDSVSETVTGWTLGGGAEFAIDRHWSLKGEYLYVQFEDVTARPSNPAFPTATHSVKDDLSANIFRLGVNYKF